MTMSRKQKHWYWEAEQDRIAADEELRLLPSPKDWPSQGLECVGLWFLMMNQMWRSPKTGYLCDPVHQDLPLKTTDLASMVGRDVQVVERVLKVIMTRKLFESTTEGIIYSRGILRKVALRKKRVSAGRKGGKATADLLKQNVKQMVEQPITLGIGIQNQNSHGSEIESPDAEDTRLAQKAAFLAGDGLRPSAVTRWLAFISDLRRFGIAAAVVEAELDRPDRMRSEAPWEFQKRLLDAAGISNGKKKQPLRDAAKSAMDWANREAR